MAARLVNNFVYVILISISKCSRTRCGLRWVYQSKFTKSTKIYEIQCLPG